ncbi:MAG: GNAT family N-acetyltransferase [Roseiflexaceae bacterium]
MPHGVAGGGRARREEAACGRAPCRTVAYRTDPLQKDGVTFAFVLRPSSERRSSVYMMIIRPATATEQATITAIVRAARINPSDLDWRRFLVAEQGGQIVGVVQVRPHRDGSRELASLAVVPEQQGQGVGAALVGALLARERGPLDLMCTDQMEGYYARFGFRRLASHELAPYFRRIMWIARVISFIAKLGGMRMRMTVMRRG